MQSLRVTVGWTGGQYSVFRVIFGSYLLVHFLGLLPWATEVWSNEGVIPSGSDVPTLMPWNVLQWLDAPAFVFSFISLLGVASVFFLLGSFDRVAAIFLWYGLSCLFGRNPLTLNPSLPFVGWMLLLHAALPTSPFGAWSARRRLDPRGDWHFPGALFCVAWVLMAAGYTYSGYTKLISPSWMDGTALEYVLRNPLARTGLVRDLMLALPSWLLHLMTWGGLAAELLFAPLALIPRLRPWLWLSLLFMHLGLLILIDFADLSLGMVMLHFLTFNPSWIRARSSEGTHMLFYDGSCGLCHHAVRFVLAESRDREGFRFAALQGTTFQEKVPEDKRKSFPDSMALLTPGGELLVRSSAAVGILKGLGGIWSCLGFVFGLVPCRMRDFLYDQVAAIRHRLFAKPKEECPLLPPELRMRFDP